MLKKPPKRVSFQDKDDIIDLPNLIEVQVKSYKQFLQAHLLPHERENVGLENVKFEDLKGHIGVVFTENDAIKATQVTYKFSESQGDQIKVLTGRLDGKIYSQDDLKEISKLPTEDVMRAQFVGLLESPMSSLLSVLENSITGVLYCLEEKGKKSN